MSVTICGDYPNPLTFLIENIITHSSIFRAHKAEAIKGVCEPFSASTLCEHSQ
jgi:hypothetical protein